MHGHKRTLDTDAYSESSSPKRALSEDPSDNSTSSPAAGAAQQLLPPSAPGGQQQQQQQQAVSIEHMHITSAEDSSAADDPSSPSPVQPQASVSSSTLSASMPATTSTLGAELEADMAADDEEARVKALSNAEKLEMITNLKKQPLNVGDFWFLVDRQWYRRFATLLSELPERPLDSLAPITNGDLLDGNNALRPNLQEGVDVEIVPESAWVLLKAWFGADEEVKRKVIPGGGVGNERVEFYEPEIFVHLIQPSPSTPDPKNLANTFIEPFKQRLSSATTYRMFSMTTCRSRFHVAPADARFWRLDGGRAPFAPILTVSQAKEAASELVPSTPGETLESLSIGDGARLAVEYRAGPTSPWPMDGDGSSTSSVAASNAPRPLFGLKPNFVDALEARNAVASGSGSDRSEGSSSGGPGLAKKALTGITGMLTRSKATGEAPGKGRNGLMGLTNLGNTCFMNSAIQCMSNTTELNKYFLSGVYKDELNRSNPLGMKGQVADAFGDLITRLHHGSSSSYSPSDFKRTLARFAPSFSGYQQHDSQEFITFLLDGLHEDLNRIKKKPYVESPDWNGGGDVELAQLAAACWENYKKRNDSVIVDLFQGQYKSTLVCPKCGKVSITFDPFMYLTLPVPVKKTFQATVVFVPSRGERVKVELSVPKEASFAKVKQLLAGWFKTDASRLVACEIWKSAIYKTFADYEPLSDIAKGDEVVFYEVDTPVRLSNKDVFSDDPDHIIIPVFTGCATTPGDARSSELVGSPFFITLSLAQACDASAIERAVVEQYEKLLTPGEEGKLYAEPGTVFETEDDLEDELEEEEDDDAMASADDDNTDTPADEISLGPEVAPPSPPTVDLFPNSPTDFTPATSPMGFTPTASPAPSPRPASPASAAAPDDGAASPAALRPVFSIGVFEGGGGYDSHGDVPSGSPPIRAVHALGTPYSGQFNPRGLRPAAASAAAAAQADGDASLHVAPTSQLMLGARTGILCLWEPAAIRAVLAPDGTTLFDEAFAQFTDPAVEADRGKRRTKTVLSIEDCLDEFSREETLGEDDLWYCSTCKEHQAATKKLELWKTPDILVVHLKRFGGSRGLRDKIDNLIEFPVEDFDLGGRVGERKVARSIELAGGDATALGLEGTEEPLIYDLYGVDQHFGGLGGGHYTAAAKSGEDGKWYGFDDSRVSPIADPASVVTPAAYVLFYRRRVQRTIGGATHLRVEAALARSRATSPAAAAAPAPSTLTSPFASAPATRAPSPGPGTGGSGGGGGLRDLAASWSAGAGGPFAPPSQRPFPTADDLQLDGLPSPPSSAGRGLQALSDLDDDDDDDDDSGGGRSPLSTAAPSDGAEREPFDGGGAPVPSQRPPSGPVDGGSPRA